MSRKTPTKQTTDVAISEKKDIRKDGWANFAAGLSSKVDKSTKTYYKSEAIITDEELEAMYASDGIAARIVDVVADDMTREWIKLTISKDTQLDEEAIVEAYEAELTRLNAATSFNTALKWSRLFGGSVIVIGALDGKDLEEPLNIKSIKTVDKLLVVDRTCVDIALSDFQNEPKEPNFGEPIKLYIRFYSGGFSADKKVHMSRCILFKGKPMPKAVELRSDLNTRFWGTSELTSGYNILRNYGGAMAATSNIIYEFIIGKYSLSKLAEMLAAGREADVLKRMEIIDMCKSVLHGVLLGENESYTRDAANVGGLADLLDRFMMSVSGAFGIPVTRLFGRSPAGLNATGDSDTNNYYDMVRSQQLTKLKPAIQRLLEVVAAEKKITLPVDIEFNSLTQLTEAEQADLDKTKAETEKAEADMYDLYIKNAVLTPEDVYNLRWRKEIEHMQEEMAGEEGIEGQMSPEEKATLERANTPAPKKSEVQPIEEVS
jgi:hypothetical protein